MRVDNAVDTTGEHGVEELEAVCRAIYGDGWEQVPYWYVGIVREQAVRVLDWLAVKELL